MRYAEGGTHCGCQVQVIRESWVIGRLTNHGQAWRSNIVTGNRYSLCIERLL
jgi:hypothetical protein